MRIPCGSADARLPITRANYTRTFWARDAYGTPTYTNLYGAHPIYVNQKVGDNPTANGVFLLNSEGMDIKFPDGQYIEYNAIGGIADLFFFNGPTPGDVAQQATEVFGKPDEVPYWALGVSHRRGVAYTSSTAASMATKTSWRLPRSLRM